jgi:murein DD-endopeptidase MepM/ murein hydrolase activator NlpD
VLTSALLDDSAHFSAAKSRERSKFSAMPRFTLSTRARRILWGLGFVARLTLGGLILGTVVLFFLRHRDAAALVRYHDRPDALVVPVAGVERAALRSTWEAPRSGHRRHEGIDILAPRGTLVVAAAAGEVTKVGVDRLGGNVVWIAGAGASFYYYAHLDSFAPGLHAGQQVTAGTPLGRVGNSGNARGGATHLHFGIYPLGRAFQAVDPTPLLQ